MTAIQHEERPEITDLVVAYDPETLARIDVRKVDVLARLEEHGMRRAIAIVEGWPERGGVLARDFVDLRTYRAHLEIQRLSEEFQQGNRMLRLLRPLAEALSRAGSHTRVRIADVGCGLGYTVRWLAMHGQFPEAVELHGCDYNAVLIEAATRLAQEEGLHCTFAAENAFRLRSPATIFMSTGVIHHFRRASLDDLFAQQHASGASAFIHCDIKPTYLAGVGSYIFHHARMHEALARHDGVLSALRAHPGSELLRVARKACPGWRVGVFDGGHEAVPVLRVMQALVGVRPEHADAWVERLGPLASRLHDFR